MEGLHHDTNLDQEEATSGDKEGSSDAENTESSEAVAGNRPEVGGVGEIDYSKEAANRELSPEEKIEFLDPKSPLKFESTFCCAILTT